MNTIEIEKRYSALAGDDCCLSCGGAVDYSKPLEGETCLDMGSGRGTDVLRLAEAVGPTGFVHGLDVSEGMISKARKNARKLGVKNVEFMRNELEDIGLTDQSVDLVISNCTLNHALNKKKVWQEIYRVLKNNGRFVVSDIYSIKKVPEKYRDDPKAVAECWAGAITREEYLKVLEVAGFQKVSVLEESAPYPKGEIEVASWTITARKKEYTGCCCCS
jgi:ubiquinone/menaquinone biosynthesis C-methylase UbiE